MLCTENCLIIFNIVIVINFNIVNNLFIIYTIINNMVKQLIR